MDSEFQQLKEKISEINARNARVESDKAWETSWFRVLFITQSLPVIKHCGLLTGCR